MTNYNGNVEFFSSFAFKDMKFATFLLTKIYRQNDTDEKFKDVLNRIRVCEQTQADLDYLNQRVMSEEDYIPKWHRELELFTQIKPLIILDGNVLDVYQYPVEGSTPKGSIIRLTDYLYYFFKDAGYQDIVFYDSTVGFYNERDHAMMETFSNLVHTKEYNGTINASFRGVKDGSAANIVRTALSQNKTSTVIVMNMASRYIASPDNLQQEEVDAYAALVKASLDARDVMDEKRVLRKNLLILIVNKVNDVPAWFYLQNPNVKTISIDAPSKEERESLVMGKNFSTFFDKATYEEDKGEYHDDSKELRKIQERFVALTDGMSFTELNGLRKLCKKEKLHIREMCDVVDLYKYGIRENPWKTLDLDEIRNAKERFEARVKGQPYAQTKTLDIIKRAITGLSGLQGSSHGRPKGVLFFAGPTGTGKTETAKTLAEILFGSEDACIRFDMSEYSQSHSDQKLLGAPPGYVGYEAGGQLTNAVRNKPFSILLFDEIEKAHPSILDKFLQILEDGRMTDGQGRTVYFSECIIIFTSNLGIFTRDRLGERHANVTMDMPYEEVSKRVRDAIEDYFKLELGRPEILNRIGENIVVFDFIREDVAKLILNAQVEKIIRTMHSEKKIKLTISPEAREVLTKAALGNLNNGGRGIGNMVESYLINPLARFLFDHDAYENATVEIKGIDETASPVALIGDVTRGE